MRIQREQGFVLETLPDGTAKIKVPRTSDCGSCNSQGDCCEPFGNDFMLLVAKNQAGARTGQEVAVEFSSVGSGKAMAVLYILPLGALLAGSILGYNLELFGSSDASAALFSILFLVASFFGIYIYNQRNWARDARLQPIIVQILSSRAVSSVQNTTGENKTADSESAP